MTKEDSVWPLAIVIAPLVLLLVFGHRHHVDAGEPAVEIDVGATARAERAERLGNRLVANRAGGAPRGIGHATNMGRAPRGANRPYSALSQPKWIG